MNQILNYNKGVITIESIHPLYDKSMECLLCKQKSTTKKVRSRFVKVAKYDTDFCPIHADSAVNPLYYNIFVCPHCGFSYSEDFSRHFPPTTMEIILEKVSSQWVPHHFSTERSIKDAINTYKLASYCGALKKEKHIILAGICLRIAWLYRIKQNKEQEERFLKFALKEYEASYSTGDFSSTQVSEARILYLAGEISRRIGNEKAAIKYFSFVFERQKNAREASIIQMARDRFQELKRTQETTHPLLQH
ncbi:DUF2225 domain-containing protein [Peribacillus sp. FSL M8-0224]|uniref:DUF2225 domain-containing protein n=1 Tax=Peribacillus sp. FSL M8-0224 TaxID=2921568 RepID=UPI0030F9CC8F|nr:DUF2225 domain-containing protein [Brevibacterium sp. PAMC21349]